ncbi:hypothetical protein Fmac_001481 [Flemingia macrophylla]|uniref:Protein kinase domain-containing protein n=1 Tax=Flemingia macrophylla TaxID=520843 RepID=A0ABD1NHD2_9FABA
MRRLRLTVAKLKNMVTGCTAVVLNRCKTCQLERGHLPPFFPASQGPFISLSNLGSVDLVVSCLGQHWTNDLPGAMIQISISLVFIYLVCVQVGSILMVCPREGVGMVTYPQNIEGADCDIVMAFKCHRALRALGDMVHSLTGSTHLFHPRQKVGVYNEVLCRLKELNATEAVVPGFEDDLWAHFYRLPTRYALDMNVERAQDILMHKRLLDMARTATGPAVEVRLVQIRSTAASRSSKSFYSHSQSKVCPQDSCIPGTRHDSSILPRPSARQLMWNFLLVIANYKPMQTRMNFIWRIDAGSLRYEKLISSGPFSDLFKGTFCNQDVAIKVLKHDKLDENIQKEFAQEVYILRLLIWNRLSINVFLKEVICQREEIHQRLFRYSYMAGGQFDHVIWVVMYTPARPDITFCTAGGLTMLTGWDTCMEPCRHKQDIAAGIHGELVHGRSRILQWAYMVSLYMAEHIRELVVNVSGPVLDF